MQVTVYSLGEFLAEENDSEDYQGEGKDNASANSDELKEDDVEEFSVSQVLPVTRQQTTATTSGKSDGTSATTNFIRAPTEKIAQVGLNSEETSNQPPVDEDEDEEAQVQTIPMPP